MKTVLFCILFLILAIVSPVFAAADDTGTLIDAASHGDIKRVRSLLAGGADVNAKDTDGVTALMMAAQDGHTDIVKVLLKKYGETWYFEVIWIVLLM